MSAIQTPELEARISGVVCLATPFFKLGAGDVEFFLDLSGHLTNPLALIILPFGFLTAIDKFRPLLSGGFFDIAAYTFLGSLAGAALTAFFLRRKLRDGCPLDIMKRYSYSHLTLPVLALRAKYDEAFHWIALIDRLTSYPILLLQFLMLVSGVATYFLFGVGIQFFIPLCLLLPLILVVVFGLRAVIRSAPWTIGERPVIGLLASFSTSTNLQLPQAQNVTIPISTLAAKGRLRLRHSALYESDKAVRVIVEFLIAQSRPRASG